MALAKEVSDASYEQHVTAILKGTLLFSHIEDEELHGFAEKGMLKRYPKGRVLFMHEEPAERFFVIASGWVKLFRETLDGGEVVVDVLSTGHMFGETSIFDEDGLYAYGAEVVEDAEVLALPLAYLRQRIESNGQLAMQMFSAMSRFRKQQDKELEHRDLQNASQRVGCFLLRLCKPTDDGPIILHLPYDKLLIASRLGMKAETFSRALARLKQETGIRIRGATVEIDNIEQLSCYSCSACSSSYPCQDLH